MADSIAAYCITSVDLSAAERLHKLVLDYHNNLFSNDILRNDLLYRGSIPNPEPTSFDDIRTRVILREKTKLHRSVLKMGIAIATRPEVTGIRYHLDTRVDAITPQGYDAGKVEQLQRQWFEEADITATVREYERTLDQAFDEFNLQQILSCMTQSVIYRPQTREEEKIHQAIKMVLTPTLINRMDSAYYDQASSFFRSAEPLWLRLNDSPFGQKFILSVAEVEEAMGKR